MNTNPSQKKCCMSVKSCWNFKVHLMSSKDMTPTVLYMYVYLCRFYIQMLLVCTSLPPSELLHRFKQKRNCQKGVKGRNVTDCMWVGQEKASPMQTLQGTVPWKDPSQCSVTDLRNTSCQHCLFTHGKCILYFCSWYPRLLTTIQIQL